MKGAIIGDIIGCVYEHNNIKTKDFPLFSKWSDFTDDTVMTCAVADAFLELLENDGDLLETLTEYMHHYGNTFRHRGYGGRFRSWLKDPEPKPYNSFGNGAPMRCSAAGWIAGSPEKAFELGMYTAAPTHNHPEGMKAAGITAMLIWHARNGADMDELREIAQNAYELPVLDEIRPYYTFDVSCQGTMPVALSAFFESTSFEDAVRNAVSVGGDSDTIAAITGSIAEAYYGVPEELWERACEYLDDRLAKVVEDFYRTVAEVNK